MSKRLLRPTKKSIEFKSTMFALIAVSMVVISIATVLDQWEDDYGTVVGLDIGDLNKMDEIESYSVSQVEGITVKSSVSGEDFQGTVLRGVFGVLNTIFLPFNMVFGEEGMIQSVSDRYGLPIYIEVGMYLFIIFGILWTLVAIFFKIGRKSA